MAYSITVFNTKLIEDIDPGEIMASLTASNYATLCDQYGLDPALIEPTLACLNIVAGPQNTPDYFVLEYRPQNHRPIVIHLLKPDGLVEGELYRLRKAASEKIQEKLSEIKQIVSIELSEDQLYDLGLLLGYELARWAAQTGEGVIQALDGKWYRLNRHKAFLPVM